MALTRGDLQSRDRGPILKLMRRSLAWLSVVLMLLPATAAIEATTIVAAADPADLALASKAVFVGRAGSSRTVGGSSYLATETELEILEVVKGPLQIGERVVVVAPGGMAGLAGPSRVRRLPAGETYLFFADQALGRWQPRLLADSVLRRVSARTVLGAARRGEIERWRSVAQRHAGPRTGEGRQFIAALRHHAGKAGGWRLGAASSPSELFPQSVKAAPGVCAFMSYRRAADALAEV